MALPPARTTPQGGLTLEASAPLGARETERPPGPEDKTDADAGASIQAALGSRFTPGVGESTTVGPPPDPPSVEALVGPATPRGLRAAAPAAGLPTGIGPKLAAAQPRARTTAALSAPHPPLRLPHDSAPIAPPPPVVRASYASIPGIAADAPLTRRCLSCEGRYPADFLVCPRDATPLVPIEATGDDPLIGQVLNETYQIVRVVGEGGMGRVYEARHLRLRERRFAVKCLHSDLARNQEMAARFLREAESASSVNHPNVVDVFDVHHLPDGTPYLVGEFLEGEELAAYVKKRGPLDPRLAAKVARQVCNALAAAHGRGIIHRDMKPENVFVLSASIAAVERGESRGLQVKVLDFGISKASGQAENSQLTRTGVIMGTPSYMAPEQARGRQVDHRADVYSVGACLYFMVTGRRPFDSDDPTATLSMVLTEDPVRPREIDPRIPDTVELVIQRAMAKDPSDRYASMAELEKALATLTGRSSLTVPSSHAFVPVPASEPTLKVRSASSLLHIAKVMLGVGAQPLSSAQQGGAQTARPMIIVTSAVLCAWILGGTVAALAGLVRVLHDGEITLAESLLLVVGCLFAAATPVALYVMQVKKVIWPNSMRAMQLAADLKRTSIAALVTYGTLSIFGRILHTVFWRSSRGLASGLWDILLFFVSVGLALLIGGLPRMVNNLRRGRID